MLAALLLLALAGPMAGARAETAGETREPRVYERALLAASGVSSERLDRDLHTLDDLERAFRQQGVFADGMGDSRQQARAIHALLHQRVLGGEYLASASDIGAALDGEEFNCAAASALFLALARRCGLEVRAVSVRGHVWCRVAGERETFDVETTCPGWFEIAQRYAGLPNEEVSAAVAQHRRRAEAARVLSDEEFLAIFHFNRGVTLLRERKFAAAAEANRRALALDPACLPAAENLAAAERAGGE